MKFFKKQEKYVVEEWCIACKGTGDYRGEYGKNQPDYKSRKNRCLHCKGTGVHKKIFYRLCKYCGEPSYGFCCDNCARDFQEEW